MIEYLIQNVGVATDDKGRVPVDESFRTSVPRYG